MKGLSLSAKGNHIWYKMDTSGGKAITSGRIINQGARPITFGASSTTSGKSPTRAQNSSTMEYLLQHRKVALQDFLAIFSAAFLVYFLLLLPVKPEASLTCPVM